MISYVSNLLFDNNVLLGKHINEKNDVRMLIPPVFIMITNDTYMKPAIVSYQMSNRRFSISTFKKHFLKNIIDCAYMKYILISHQNDISAIFSYNPVIFSFFTRVYIILFFTFTVSRQ